MKFKVAGVGQAFIDYLAVVPAFPVENGVTICKDFDVQGGGNCANTLVGLTRLGVTTKIAGRIGDDDIGKQIKTSLETEAVSTDNLEIRGNSSSLSFVIVNAEKQTRTSIIQRGISYKEELDIDDGFLSAVDLLYIGGHFYQTELKLAKQARKAGIKVVLETEHDNWFHKELLSYADLVITSREFHKEFFGDSSQIEQNLEKMLEMGAPAAITTLGEQGSILKQRDHTIRVEACPAAVVDTTGAGDAFISGIIFGLLRDWDYQRCMNFASLIAAKKCEKLGARQGLPYLHELEEFTN